MYRIEVSIKEGFIDPRADALEKDILDLGVRTVERVRVVSVYLLEGKLAYIKPEGFDDMHRRDGIQHRLNANKEKWQRFHMGDTVKPDTPRNGSSNGNKKNGNGKNGKNGNGKSKRGSG